MAERGQTGSFGKQDVELFGFDAIEALHRSAGSGDPEVMANYLKEHGDASLIDYASVAMESAGDGCFGWLMGWVFVFSRKA